VKYSELKKRLKEFGCVEIKRKTGNSHRLWQNLENKKCGEIPFHGSKEIRMGTLRNFIKQLGLNWQEFNRY
jgi:predicted RNA binding protein YcfA (HicA-like mRNA interferase family)